MQRPGGPPFGQNANQSTGFDIVLREFCGLENDPEACERGLLSA
jgi:hypothetical protein